MDKTAAFDKFKRVCATRDLLKGDSSAEGDDVQSGIYDDGTLLRFLRAREYNVEDALQQYMTTLAWRQANQLIELYNAISVSDYEETRKLYTHWTGRRDRNGSPLCLFEIQQLTPAVMAAYSKSCSSTIQSSTSTESEAMLRLFCTYENLIRFVLPLCSTIESRPAPNSPVTDTTCIVDISGVSLMQFWRLRSHMQAASVLATSHYPETLGRTYIIGAPSFFATIWGWIGRWFDQNTVSKIRIVPQGQEYSMLSELVDPINIPQKYGGQFDFKFGMLPDLDREIRARVSWLEDGNGRTFNEMPKGPMKWTLNEDGKKTAVAVGTESGNQRNTKVMALH